MSVVDFKRVYYFTVDLGRTDDVRQYANLLYLPSIPSLSFSYSNASPIITIFIVGVGMRGKLLLGLKEDLSVIIILDFYRSK